MAAEALESRSEHPLAKAVMAEIDRRNIPDKLEISSFENLPGHGLMASDSEGHIYRAGNETFIRSYINETSGIKAEIRRLAEEGKTPMLFSKDDKLLGMIAAADVMKEDSQAAIEELKDMGLFTVMLTGDDRRTAKAVGEKAGVDSIIAGVMPDEKSAFVENYQEFGKVMMIGDGINDAPALIKADTGAAIGAGTDVALDAADVVLVKSSLRDGAAAIRLSRAVIRNIHENLFWAFIYNLICIPLAMGLFGFEMKPVYGAAAMSLSSFSVCMNALRLNLFKLYNASGDKRYKKKRDKWDGIKDKVVYNFKGVEGENPSADEEETSMKKVLKIEGMMCEHCEARVKKVLLKLDGVEDAVVSHKEGTAVVTLSADVADEILKETVEDQDYKVIGIE